MTNDSICLFVSTIFSFKDFIFSSSQRYVILFKEQASSIKSIALSGKYLSVIYLVDNSTADFTASWVIFKL